MDFPLMLRVFPFFVEAAWVTVQISVLSLLLGLAVAAVIASAKMSGSLFCAHSDGSMSACFAARHA